MTAPSGELEAFLHRHWLRLCCATYAACALILLPHYRDNLYPDTISYISIARKYVAGDFASAVNSYWAPLLSWAMVPFLWLGLDPLVSIKLVAIAAGVATIAAAGRLFEAFPILPATRRLSLLALVPGVLYFSMSMATPDLLLTALVTAYLAVICRDDYPASRAGGVLCGALGGLAYLSKHYALPFFVLHFTAMNVWHSRRNGAPRPAAINAAAGLLTCGLIAGPWVAAISDKQGALTIGTSGARTYAYMGPNSRGDTLGPHGLVPPPNPTAVSAWEDPTTDMLESWSPFESREHLRHQADLILRHLRDSSLALLSFSPLAPVILGGYAVFCVWIGKIRKAWIPLLTMALYTAGYLVVLIELRYMWPLCVLLLLTAAMLLDAVRGFLEPWRSVRQAVVAGCLGSFLVVPGVNMIRNFDAGRDLRDLGELLRERYGVHGNIAAHNQYRTPLYLSYYAGGRFFGTSDRKLADSQIENLILHHDIDYYFVLTDGAAEPGALPSFLAKYPEITGGDVPRLLVYRIRGDPPSRTER